MFRVCPPSSPIKSEHACKQWRRQPKKSGGPNNFSLLVSSKKLQYTCMGPPPPLYIKYFSTDLRKSQERSEQKWGVRTPHSPRGDATACKPYGTSLPYVYTVLQPTARGGLYIKLLRETNHILHGEKLNGTKWCIILVLFSCFNGRLFHNEIQ